MRRVNFAPIPWHGDTFVSDGLVGDGGSFRDRNNRVYDDGVRIVRGVSKDALANWTALSSMRFFKDLLAEFKIVGTELVDPAISGGALELGGEWPAHLGHERVPFVTYPYEWSFGMLRDAALLQLELIERAIESGWTMKDATAYNIQWIGCRPVFIDVPSFQPYVAGEPWVGYRQFCMMFLYPLMLQAYRGIDFQPFLRSNLEGIDPATANNLLSGRHRLRKGVLTHVYLHSKMQSRHSDADLVEARSLTEESSRSPTKRKKLRHTEAMVLGVIQGLRRIVANLRRVRQTTTWGNYDTDHSYGRASFVVKTAFVEKAVSNRHRRLVWDLGCNTGTFSKICAQYSDYVVSVDGDSEAIDRFYESEQASLESRICPLIMNLANISPGQGWRGRERKAFDKRGRPDLILCLALIHHIVISANIPLAEFLDWLREFDCEVIIEFVGPDDDMSKLLLRNKVNQHDDLTEPMFARLISSRFDIVSEEALKGGHRKLYHLTPR